MGKTSVITVACATSMAVVSFASPSMMRPFRPGETKVGGEIGNRCELTATKMVRHTDIENTFAKHFRVRKEKPAEPWGFAGYGMFLDALVKAAADGIGGDETVALKTKLLHELADAQTQDGRITMYINKAGFWDNHEGAYMIQALCLDHRWFGCEESLEIAVKLADSLIRDKTLVTLGSETAFTLLAEETGDSKYSEWLKRDGIICKSIDEYDRHLHVNGTQHVYTWLARALGQMQYAEYAKFTGVDRDRMGAAAFAAFRRLRSPELSVTGSCSGIVHWGELWDSTQTGRGKWGETCATAYLMRLAAKMPEWDASSTYGDIFERALYNAFFSAQSADGLKYRYFTPFEERAEWFDRDTYCCPNNFKREMFEVPNSVFYRTAEGLAVNLYTPAELKAEGITAKMLTAYPDDGKVALNVKMAGTTVFLRIPAWCEHAKVSLAGGGSMEVPGGDWAEVKGDFSQGASISLEMPMPIRLVRGMRAQEGKVAVLRGPCVYALECGVNGLDPQYCGLWELNATLPMVFDAKSHSITATFHERNNKHRVRQLKLTRYCNDNREKTYFDLFKEVPTVDDELIREPRASQGAASKMRNFLDERVFGKDAKGWYYDEAVNAFRTHFDDRHPESGWIKKDIGLWQGEYWGKTMLASAAVAEWRNDAALKEWLKTNALEFVKEFQQSDGCITTYSDKYFVGEGGKFCWNLWGRKYTMWALIEIARIANCKELLEAATKLMDQEIAQLTERGVQIGDTGCFAGMPSMSVLKPLLLLYRATGKEKYREFAEKIVLAWDRPDGKMPNLIANAYGKKPLYAWYSKPEQWAKAYEMMSCLEGLIDWAVNEKSDRVLNAVKLIVADLERNEVNAIGGVGFFDHFMHASAIPNAFTEPCDVVHWIRVNRELFLATDDPHYLDAIELAYHNAFLAGVYRDGKWGAHVVRSHGSRHRTAPHQVGMKYHQCCIDNMPRAFVDVANTAVTKAKTGCLSVNLFADGSAVVDGTEIEITGNYPISDRVQVAITAKEGGVVRFRVPKCFDAVRLDGKLAEGEWVVSQYAAGRCVFELVFSRSLKLVRCTQGEIVDAHGSEYERQDENPEMCGLARSQHGVRLMYGPIVLAKGRYAGTPDVEILKDRLVDGEWRIGIAPIKRKDTDGAWLLSLNKGNENIEIPVGDFATIADRDDPANLFSIWF